MTRGVCPRQKSLIKYIAIWRKLTMYENRSKQLFPQIRSTKLLACNAIMPKNEESQLGTNEFLKSDNLKVLNL